MLFRQIPMTLKPRHTSGAFFAPCCSTGTAGGYCAAWEALRAR